MSKYVPTIKNPPLSSLIGTGKYNKLTENLLSQLDSRFVVNDPKYVLSREYNNVFAAYIPKKNVIYIPVDFPGLVHQIAHMVEIEDIKRCVMNDWGFGEPKERFKYSNKMTLRILSREIRVRAIQLYLMDSWSSNLESIVHQCEDLLKPKLVNGLGKFTSLDKLYQWEDHLRQTTYDVWNEERIITEWNNRISFIKEWMESPSNNEKIVA